ncbi:unnamed protein product [Paramecium primaurelia]|uniref:Ubiquitin-like domain-containing protein n=1 Tax=Paramecium primaurelia TaxID=5886 RepID=A0A8S1N972_PARPR|nr:unnamed protein product [Paramecium primaurelia]
MNLRIEIFGSKPQIFQVNKSSSVSEVIDIIIQKNKLKELNQQLSLYLNGIELNKETRIQNYVKFVNDTLQLKKNEQVRQLQGIKLVYNNEIKIAYVYLDDSNYVLYDQAEKQFSLSKDSFKLICKDQILEKLAQLKQNQIDANSTIVVKMLNQLNQPKQMINLKLKYQQQEKILAIDIYSKIFELEEKVKSLFKINQEICILNDKKILLQDQKLIDVDFNQNFTLTILLKELYSNSLSYVKIFIEYNGQKFEMSVATNTLISEIIDLLQIQNNLTNIDLMMDSHMLPQNQTITQLNVKENSILNVVTKQNNTILVLNLKIGFKLEKIEVDQETIIQELIQQIESNFQLQNIQLTLQNGQQLQNNQSLKQQNIQSGTQLIIQRFYPNQNKLSTQNDLINIQVSLQPSQQIISYQISYNSLIQDLQKTISNNLNCQNKIQLVYQNRILNQQSTFAQEGIPNGCQLQCNILIDKIDDKIKIIDEPIISDSFIQVLIIFQNQQIEKMLRGNTLVDTLINSLKSQLSLNQDIQLMSQGKILNPKQTLKENEIKQKSQIIVELVILQLCIVYKGQMENLEVSLDTSGEELKFQIKKSYEIENDFDIIINGVKMDTKLQLKDLKLQNKQCLEIQEKQIKITEQTNLTNQQLQQQGYQQGIQNNQINQQIQSKQYQQSQQQQQQQQQQNQQGKSKAIKIKEITDIKLNKNNEKEQPNIKLISNNWNQTIQFQWETKIKEIIEYIKNQKQIKDQIKLTFNNNTLKPDKTLEEIGVKDQDTIYVEQIQTC